MYHYLHQMECQLCVLIWQLFHHPLKHCIKYWIRKHWNFWLTIRSFLNLCCVSLKTICILSSLDWLRKFLEFTGLVSISSCVRIRSLIKLAWPFSILLTIATINSAVRCWRRVFSRVFSFKNEKSLRMARNSENSKIFFAKH